MDLDNVGVFKPGDSLGLAAEARQLFRIHMRAGRNHLQSHQPLEANLAGLVDHPHAAPG
jgi:hypothetical protein